MQIELDGPGVVGGMVSGVVRVDDDADGDDIEIQLVWVERSGQKFSKAEKARVVARADASPETDMRFSLAIPESTSPGWSDSTCSFNLEVKVKQNFLKSPIAEVVEIDQNSFPSPTEAHVAEIGGDVRKGRRRVLSGEVSHDRHDDGIGSRSHRRRNLFHHQPARKRGGISGGCLRCCWFVLCSAVSVSLVEVGPASRSQWV